MIAHVVTFTWRDGVTDEEIQTVYRAHQMLADTVEGLVDLQFGPNLAVAQNTADYAVVVVAETVNEILGYLDHPDHVALVRDHTSNMVSARNAVQIDWDPRSS